MLETRASPDGLRTKGSLAAAIACGDNEVSVFNLQVHTSILGNTRGLRPDAMLTPAQSLLLLGLLLLPVAWAWLFLRRASVCGAYVCCPTWLLLRTPSEPRSCDAHRCGVKGWRV